MAERFGLVHLLDAAAVDREFPAVIDAAQPALLVAPEPQGGAAMGAILVDEPDPALAVAKGDEVFAQEPHPHRRSVGLGEFAREQGRDPIEPHRAAHRRALPTRLRSSFSSRGSIAQSPHRARRVSVVAAAPSSSAAIRGHAARPDISSPSPPRLCCYLRRTLARSDSPSCKGTFDALIPCGHGKSAAAMSALPLGQTSLRGGYGRRVRLGDLQR